MRWTWAGADAIIALRCEKAGSQREAARNSPYTQTRTCWPSTKAATTR
jgi:hypothetical protein